MFKCQIIILWRSLAWIFNLDILSMYYWISVWSSKISKAKKSFEKTKRISTKIGAKEERPNITMGQIRIKMITLTVQNLPDRSNKFIIRIDSAPERFSTSPIIFLAIICRSRLFKSVTNRGSILNWVVLVSTYNLCVHTGVTISFVQIL